MFKRNSCVIILTISLSRINSEICDPLGLLDLIAICVRGEIILTMLELDSSAPHISSACGWKQDKWPGFTRVLVRPNEVNDTNLRGRLTTVSE